MAGPAKPRTVRDARRVAVINDQVLTLILARQIITVFADEEESCLLPPSQSIFQESRLYTCDACSGYKASSRASL